MWRFLSFLTCSPRCLFTMFVVFVQCMRTLEDDDRSRGEAINWLSWYLNYQWYIFKHYDFTVNRIYEICTLLLLNSILHFHDCDTSFRWISAFRIILIDSVIYRYEIIYFLYSYIYYVHINETQITFSVVSISLTTFIFIAIDLLRRWNSLRIARTISRVNSSQSIVWFAITTRLKV